MKFRRLIFVFIALLAVVAWLTKPKMEKFKSYYATLPNKPMMPPVIEEHDYFLYSTYTVTYFSIAGTPDIKAKDVKTGIAIAGEKTKYLGLFSRIWPLD